jgi:hypothetical protein
MYWNVLNNFIFPPYVIIISVKLVNLLPEILELY